MLAKQQLLDNCYRLLVEKITNTSPLIATAPTQILIASHIRRGFKLLNSYHNLIINTAVDASDEIFESILDLLVLEKVSVDVYYTGIAHAATKKNHARIYRLMSIIESMDK